MQDTDRGSRCQMVRVHVEDRRAENTPGAKVVTGQQLFPACFHHLITSSFQRLQIRLTDDTDLYFLYSLVITEDDFQTLKSQQSFVVDFHKFGEMIRQLLEKCVTESRSEAPKFRLVLECGGSAAGTASGMAVLNIQEVNSYRHLCHLSLKVCRGSDTQVKEHLAEWVKRLREESSAATGNLAFKLQQAESELYTTRTELRSKSEELERLRLNTSEQSSTFTSRLEHEIAKEKERATATIVELQERYDRERGKTVEDHKTSVRLLENRVASLDYENKDLLEKRHKNEALIQSLRDKLKTCDDDKSDIRTVLDKKRLEIGKLEQELSEKHMLVNELRAKTAAFEQERQRLHSELRGTGELLQACNEQKAFLEQDLKEKVDLVARREGAARTVSQELGKANEVIKKYIEQVKATQKKLKVSSQVIEEQEKVILNKDSELNSVREDLRKASEALSTEKSQKSDIEISERRLREQVEELEKGAKRQEMVIHWLNQQLTVAQARDPNLRFGPPPDGVSFTPSAMMASSTPLGQYNAGTKSRRGLNDISEESSIQMKSGMARNKEK